MKDFFKNRICCFFFGKNINGFSLIELSVIISISAALAVGYLAWTRPASVSDATKTIETRKKLYEITSAIEAFRVREGRLPCPADPLMREDGTYLSGEDLYPNDYGTEDLDIDQTSINGTITLGIDCPNPVGSVPIYALDLSAAYMFDAWDRRFTYHVSNTLCGADQGTTIVDDTTSKQKGCSRYDYTNNNGNIRIENANGDALTPVAAFIVLSHGSNGLGGRLASGRLIETSVDVSEAENSNSNNEYVLSEPTATYDDVMLYRTKTQLEQLSRKHDSVLVRVERCQANAEMIHTLTSNSLATVKTELDDYQQEDLNTGDQVALSILLALQEACVQYYGSEADVIDGWDGAQCPGTGKYNTNTRACECPTGDWTNCCPDNDWDVCFNS